MKLQRTAPRYTCGLERRSGRAVILKLVSLGVGRRAEFESLHSGTETTENLAVLLLVAELYLGKHGALISSAWLLGNRLVEAGESNSDENVFGVAATAAGAGDMPVVSTRKHSRQHIGVVRRRTRHRAPQISFVLGS
jgi:hypothetical protein